MASEVEGLRKYLSRTKTAAELKTYADQLFAQADELVVLTSQGFEGGSHAGQVQKYSRAEILDVVEDLIREKDPAIADAPPRRSMIAADWSGSISTL